MAGSFGFLGPKETPQREHRTDHRRHRKQTTKTSPSTGDQTSDHTNHTDHTTQTTNAAAKTGGPEGAGGVGLQQQGVTVSIFKRITITIGFPRVTITNYNSTDKKYF